MVGVDVQETNRPNDGGYNHLFKVALIGPASVGKSAMLSRFVDNSFTSEYHATIGVDFKTKTVQTSDNQVVKLQMWDTAGQERFRVISHSYYRGAHGILLVFDITQESSFQSMDNFYKEVREKSFADCSVVLVGTNSDSKDERKVTQEQAEDFASKNGITYFEVSSKTGDDISRTFEILVEQMMMTQRKERPLGAMSTMPHALQSKVRAKTSHNTDGDSLHELENETTMLKSTRFQKKSAFCTIL